jgi:hypothetical protein
MSPAKEKALRAEVIALRKAVRRLAKLFYTHARTDLAPDACLPATKALLRDLGVKP